jgi:hypothetical protein
MPHREGDLMQFWTEARPDADKLSSSFSLLGDLKILTVRWFMATHLLTLSHTCDPNHLPIQKPRFFGINEEQRWNNVPRSCSQNESKNEKIWSSDLPRIIIAH